MGKRVPLKERREQDKKGVDALFETTKSPTRPGKRPSGKEPLAKVTLYIRPDQVLALEEIQLDVRKRTGRKPDKSALTIEAFDLLIQKYRKL